jgi:prophage regulatory protein
MKPQPPTIKHRVALRLPRVTLKTGISRSSIYRLIAKKQFPPPSKLSERISAWDEEEIDAWLAARFSS